MKITASTHTALHDHDATAPSPAQAGSLSDASPDGATHNGPRDRDALALALRGSPSSRGLVLDARANPASLTQRHVATLARTGQLQSPSASHAEEIDQHATPSSDNEDSDQEGFDLDFSGMDLVEPEIPYRDYETVLASSAAEVSSQPTQS